MLRFYCFPSPSPSRLTLAVIRMYQTECLSSLPRPPVPSGLSLTVRLFRAIALLFFGKNGTVARRRPNQKNTKQQKIVD